jgi:hypothetical protein
MQATCWSMKHPLPPLPEIDSVTCPAYLDNQGCIEVKFKLVMLTIFRMLQI